MKRFIYCCLNKESRSYFIPKKSELLKYIDETYFEKTKAYKSILKYVKKNFFKGKEEKADWLCEEIQDLSKLGLSIQVMLDYNLD